MAGGINVGSVLVDVLPDARGWDEKLSAQIAPAAEAVGKKISRDLEDDIADGARRGAEKAKVDLATIGDAHVKVKVDVDEDASAAEVKRAALRMGTEFGTDFSNATSKQTSNMSPLIMAAVAGGLLAGGPLLIAAAGVAAGGVAAVFLHNQKDVADAASEMGKEVTAAYQGVADAAIPDLTLALGKLRNAAVGLAPQMRDLFTAVGPAIQGVTDGIIGLAQGAMPGLVAAVKSGAPVFDGLKNFLTSIGTGLGDMFRLLSEHAPAFGQVFTSLGDVVGALLPILGDLMSAGGELGSMILPPLAAVLGVIGDVLHLIAPILPEVALGFAAFKVVSTLEGPLDSFAQKLAFASYNGGLLGKVAGGVSTAVSTLGSALPVLGTAVTIVGAAFVMHTQAVDAWAHALLEGGAAARSASAEMAKLDAGVHTLTSGTSGVIGSFLGYGNALSAMGHSSDEARKKSQELLAAMDPLHRAQQLATNAQNDLSDALSRGDARGAAKALGDYKTQTAEAKHQQELLNAALNHTSVAEEENKTRLQGLANTAGAANSQINLLKGALDALTGKAVSMGDAEVAVTNAVTAAKTALDGQKDAAGNLTSKLTDANGALDKHTAAGAAAWTALTQLSGSSNQLIATMEKQGATSSQVAAKDAELRQQFIDTATQMGFSAGEAQNLANQIYGIPEKRNAEITADTKAASDAVAALAAHIAAIQSKTVTVTVRGAVIGDHVAGLNGGPGGTSLAGAIGGVVHAYAGGGIEPMQGGIAQIVPPQTYRIIGDRVTDDEAYIPINNSLRSLQILSETAGRMNFDLAPAGGRGGKSSGNTPVLQIGQYYEAGGSSARDTAEELAWMARVRG